MDNTLAQILSHCFELEIENIQLKQKIEEFDQRPTVLPAGTPLPEQSDTQS